MGAAAAGAMEARFVSDGGSHLRFDTSVLPDRDFDDLVWPQEEITADLLELVDADRPGHFEDRADRLVYLLGLSAEPRLAGVC